MNPARETTDALRGADEAQARCFAYGLLADLLARGVTEETLEAARTSGALADALASYAPGDLDAIAVDHERAFGWSVPPFEGAFLSPDRTIGGGSTDALWASFERAGFAPDTAREDVEHLSTALRCLAFLAGAEADAIEDGHAGALERVRELARALLDEHVLRWVPAFVSAVARVGGALPTALVTQIEALLIEHRAGLPGAPRRGALPEPPALLDDPETGLREIGELLATPTYAGIYLSREDVARLGRGLKVPRGFGDRAQLLVNLLRAAAQYDAFDGLLDALDAELEAQAEALGDARYRDVDALVAPWRERALETRTLLGLVRAGLDGGRFADDSDEPASSPG